MNKPLILLALLVVGVATFCLVLTRDGTLITPQGSGRVTVGSKQYEAMPLPEYAARQISSEYKSYFVEVEPGIKVHVLEVGQGYPVLLQHGNPTSGFLYRRVASELPTDRLRLLMPTLVGLGFSSKVPASMHTLENHMRWINGVLTELEISKAIYVGQDWGGPVGMGALALSPGVLRGAVVMNTGFNAPTEKRDLSTAHATVKTPVVGELIVEFSGQFLQRLRQVQGDPNSMPDEVIELYGRPLADSGNGKAPLALMRMVPDGPQHPSAERMRFIEKYVGTLGVPVEIVWGMNDPILGPGLERMKQNFPNAPVTKTQAGHFLQEEVPREIAAAIVRVHAAVSGSGE